jgi:hypothetical protein
MGKTEENVKDRWYGKLIKTEIFVEILVAAKSF